MRPYHPHAHDDDRTAVIRSGPVPVSPPDDDRTALITHGPGGDRTAPVTGGPDEDRTDQPFDRDRTALIATGRDHDRPAPDDDDDDDRTEFHEPAPQPTVFGASTVGGAVAASAMAGDQRATEHDVRDEDRDRSTDGAAGTEPATDTTAEPVGTTDTAAERADGDLTGRADGDFPDADPADRTAGPVAVAADQPDGTVGNSDTTVVAPSDAHRTAGSAPAEPDTRLFSTDAVQRFRDRLRDVQLRFVDDPK
ncbi:MAG TPA: hypothetical protein VGD43_21500, partial [Micromonospora sp.]